LNNIATLENNQQDCNGKESKSPKIEPKPAAMIIKAETRVFFHEIAVFEQHQDANREQEDQK
jgi:hypothetical protein